MKIINFSLKKSVLLFSIIIFLLLVTLKNQLFKKINSDARNNFLGSTLQDIYSSHWIVITTINVPSYFYDKIKFFTLWKVCVIGDEKTPTDWRSDDVIFISIRDQMNLGYKIINLLQSNRYTRKMIGYLYAIQHGATHIMDMDEDNIPLENFGRVEYRNSILGLLPENITLVFNPFPHFGQMILWPRGFPLDYISSGVQRSYKLCKIKSASIIEALVRGDPDVDALMRMSRARSSNHPLDLQFDELAPPIHIPHSIFSPFNSQNTLIHAQTFWALFLPQMFTDRETDIYRSYWAQRLMWLIDEHISFDKMTVRHKRSGHSNLQDFNMEMKLYSQMSNYLKFLQSWNCTEGHFIGCILKLSGDLVERSFWHKDDFLLLEAWITDLQAIQYRFSELHSPTSLDQSCIGDLIFHPVEQKTSFANMDENELPPSANRDLLLSYVLETCGMERQFFVAACIHQQKLYHKSTLIVKLTHAYADIIPALEATYRIYFDVIFYCTSQIVDQQFARQWRISVLRLTAQKPGVMSCLLSAWKSGIGVGGASYIFLSDAMLLPSIYAVNSRTFLLPKNLSAICTSAQMDCVHVPIRDLSALGARIGPEAMDGCFRKLLPRDADEHQTRVVQLLTDFPLFVSSAQMPILDRLNDKYSSARFVGRPLDDSDRSSLRGRSYDDLRGRDSNNITGANSEQLPVEQSNDAFVITPRTKNRRLNLRRKKLAPADLSDLKYLEFLLPYFLSCGSAEFLERVEDSVARKDFGPKEYLYPVNILDGRRIDDKPMFCDFLKS